MKRSHDDNASVPAQTSCSAPTTLGKNTFGHGCACLIEHNVMIIIGVLERFLPLFVSHYFRDVFFKRSRPSGRHLVYNLNTIATSILRYFIILIIQQLLL